MTFHAQGPPQDAQTRNNPAVTGFYGYVAPSTGPKMDVSNLTALPQEFAKHIPRRERANLERNFVDLDVAAQGVGDTWDAETAPKITVGAAGRARVGWRLFA